MENLEQLKLLKKLYQCRAFGYKYFNNIDNIELSKNSNLKFASSMNELKNSIKNCHLCNLSKTRKNLVFGEGNEKSNIMFVGEAPGAMEDEKGRPFVGRAGQLLTKIIENVLEIKREDVYIANIIKCRPPNNRVPTLDEVDQCKPFLMQQLKLVDPQIIVALGATSYRHLTGDLDTPISRVRGEIIEFGKSKLIPTFHPSFLLRNPSAKKDVYMDMLKVKGMI